MEEDYTLPISLYRFLKAKLKKRRVLKYFTAILLLTYTIIRVLKSLANYLGIESRKALLVFYTQRGLVLKEVRDCPS